MIFGHSGAGELHGFVHHHPLPYLRGEPWKPEIPEPHTCALNPTYVPEPHTCALNPTYVPEPHTCVLNPTYVPEPHTCALNPTYVPEPHTCALNPTYVPEPHTCALNPTYVPEPHTCALNLEHAHYSLKPTSDTREPSKPNPVCPPPTPHLSSAHPLEP
jgi:hypothetical protein